MAERLTPAEQRFFDGYKRYFTAKTYADAAELRDDVGRLIDAVRAGTDNSDVKRAKENMLLRAATEKRKEVNVSVEVGRRRAEQAVINRAVDTYKAWRNITGNRPNTPAEEAVFASPGGIYEQLASIEWDDETAVIEIFQGVFDADVALDNVVDFNSFLVAKRSLEQARHLQHTLLDRSDVHRSRMVFLRLEAKYRTLEQRYLDLSTLPPIPAVQASLETLQKELEPSVITAKQTAPDSRDQVVGIIAQGQAEYEQAAKTVTLKAPSAGVEANEKLKSYALKTLQEYKGLIGESLDSPGKNLRKPTEETRAFSEHQFNLLYEWAHTTLSADEVNFVDELWDRMDYLWSKEKNNFNTDDLRLREVIRHRAWVTLIKLHADNQPPKTPDPYYSEKYQYLNTIVLRGDALEKQMVEQKTKAADVDSSADAVPTTEGVQAWIALYLKRYESDKTSDKREFRAYVKKKLLELEKAESAFSEQKTFSETQYGLPYVGLADFFQTHLGLKDKASYDAYFKEDHRYLENRLRIIDMMGPYAASALMTTDFMELTKLYPRFDAFNLQYFIGTGVKENYEHSDLIKQLMLEAENIMTETPEENASDLGFTHEVVIDDTVTPPKTKTVYTKGYLAFGSGAWMSREGGKHEQLMERLKAYLISIASSRDRKNKTLTLKGQVFTNAEIDMLIRIAFSVTTLTSARAKLFMEYFAVGMSPPPFIELKTITDCYPQAKELNLATKTVMEIPSVILGNDIDPQWLFKMAVKIQVKKPKSIVRPGDKEYITETDSLDVLTAIRDDFSIVNDDKYVRFRNLLRSIHLSQAKREMLQTYFPHRHMHLQDARGKQSHGHGAHAAPGTPTDEYFLVPLFKPPWEFFTGVHELPKSLGGGRKEDDPGYFAALSTQLGEHWVKAKDAVIALEHLVDSPPPKLEPGEANRRANTTKLVNDFKECLSKTSSMKAEIYLVNWQEIRELYEKRLHILFAAYHEVHGNPVAVPIPDIETIGKRIIKTEIKEYNLVTMLREAVITSGQTLGKIKDWEGKVILHPHPFDPKSGGLTLKDYLLEILPQPNKKDLNPFTMARRIAGLFLGPRLEDKAFIRVAIDMYRGYDRVKAGPKWVQYVELRNRYKVQQDTLDKYGLPISTSHAEAKSEQKSEIEGKKGGH